MRDWEPDDPREGRRLTIEAWIVGVVMTAALALWIFN
jgi:hypothetical protein